MRQRILAAAAAVLAELPLAKLTMDDVARSAGIARQTIYKHFANRDEIVVSLFVNEIQERHVPALQALHAQKIDGEQLTTIFLTQIGLANQWVLLDRTFKPTSAPRVAEMVLSSEQLAACNAELWTPILEDYQQAGVLRPEVDIARAIHWLTYQSVWLLSHPDALTRDPDDRRAYVRTFLFGALLAPAV